jgi:Fe-S cluster biogenesis protein NfuA
MALDRDAIESALNVVRPRLQADGGDIKLIDTHDDGTVVVQLQGACHGCPMAGLTLASQVECVLKDRVPGVTKVVNHSM